MRCEVLRTTVLNCCAHEKTGAALFRKKARLPYADFGVSLLLAKAGQQAVQRDKGLVDDVDVVDDGACTGEDAGDVVEHLANVQEGLVGAACTAVQIGHLLGVDHGVAGGQFHGRSSHGKIPFFIGINAFYSVVQNMVETSRVVSRAPATSAGPTYFCH